MNARHIDGIVSLWFFRENNPQYIKDIFLKGIGIGNGFVSAEDQSLYSDYISTLTYVSKSQHAKLKEHDNSLLEALSQKNYSQVHKSLNPTSEQILL